MAKSIFYHKINIESVLDELEKIQTQNPWPRDDDDTFVHPSTHPDKVKFNQGADSEEILRFEATTGHRLPDDYKAFLKRSNGAHIFEIELYGLKDIEHKSFTYLRGEQERKAREVYAIAHWYTGDDILLNLEAPAGAKNKNRRDIIDRFHEGDECEVIAKSFGEFLYRIIEGSKLNKELRGDPEDWEINNAMYWLQDGFSSYREIYGVEFDD